LAQGSSKDERPILVLSHSQAPDSSVGICFEICDEVNWIWAVRPIKEEEREKRNPKIKIFVARGDRNRNIIIRTLLSGLIVLCGPERTIGFSGQGALHDRPSEKCL